MDDGEIRSGNVGAVERRGGTLRRPVGRWTPAVHALLRHLELAGFAAAPRVVCVEADVEVLTYIEGEVPGEPWPVALRTDATLTEIGRVLRAFHEAYGADPLAVVDAAQRVRRTETDQLRDLGGRGVEPYATFLARGAVEAMRLSGEWLERHRDQLI